jgi:hypothetical protein
MTAAARPAPIAGPLDWMTTPTPREWNINGTRIA